MTRFAVLFLSAAAALAQTEPPKGLKVWFADGTGLLIQTRSTGANAPRSTSGEESEPAGYAFHRIVFDNQGTLLLGYDVEARKVNQSIVVRIMPIDKTKFQIGGNKDWQNIPTLSGTRTFPPLQTGDEVQVDILHNPSTGEKIYDVLKVLESRTPSSATAKGRPLFSLSDIKVAIDGAVIDEKHYLMMCGGLMVYLPRRGVYFLTPSATSDSSFKPAGWVDHAILRFHAGSELVEITSKTNILQSADYGTIWIRRAPESVKAARLKEALDEARKKYSPRHPDVLALEKMAVDMVVDEKLAAAANAGLDVAADKKGANQRAVGFSCGDDVESLMRIQRGQ